MGLTNGIKIPAIGFGTWALAEGPEAINAITQALDAGYRLIDTAKIYANERSVGQVIKKSLVPRQEIFITTKLPPNDFGYDSALRTFDESLGRLGLEYIDLYLMHWPGQDKTRRQEAWRALIEIYKQGRARAIGVSNYKVEHLVELKDSEVAPAVNQIEFHPYIYQEQLPILEFCRHRGIVVEAYSPLGGGHALNSITLIDIAERLGKSPAQVLLRWAIQHRTVPIPKSATSERIRQNIQVFDFELSSEDMKALDNLGSS